MNQVMQANDMSHISMKVKTKQMAYFLKNAK